MSIEIDEAKIQKLGKKLREAIKLRSCKDCNYCTKTEPLYCTKQSPPTRILTEYWAHGCSDYTVGQAVIAIQHGGQIEWYDRNPVSKALNYNNISVAPHSNTDRIEYTCPANKISMVEMLSLKVMRNEAATTVGAAKALLQIIRGEETKMLLQERIVTNNVGDKDKDSFGSTITLYAGDKLKVITADTSTGGSCAYFTGFKVTEFDA